MNRSIAVAIQAVCGGSLLLACTTVPQNTMPFVKPNYEVRHSGKAAEAFYQIGRHYQVQGDFRRAAIAYRKAIEANKNHVEAHNALGTVLASQGLYEEARDSFAQALAISPTSAHVHNNLGYTYFMWQRKDDAMVELRRANELEPNNLQFRNNLALAQGEAPSVKAELPSSSAAAPAVAVSMPAPFDVVGSASQPLMAAVVPGQAALPIIDIPSPSSTPTVDVATLQTLPPVPPAAPAETPTVERFATFRMEVANGNGVTGMARYVSRLLLAQGLPKARLTNEKPFTQRNTTVEYRQGFEAQARALSERLPGRPFPKPWTQPQGDLRVVLGHDMPRTLNFELAARDPVTAQATGELRGQ